MVTAKDTSNSCTASRVLTSVNELTAVRCIIPVRKISAMSSPPLPTKAMCVNWAHGMDWSTSGRTGIRGNSNERTARLEQLRNNELIKGVTISAITSFMKYMKMEQGKKCLSSNKEGVAYENIRPAVRSLASRDWSSRFLWAEDAESRECFPTGKIVDETRKLEWSASWFRCVESTSWTNPRAREGKRQMKDS